MIDMLMLVFPLLIISHTVNSIQPLCDTLTVFRPFQNEDVQVIKKKID